MSTAVPVPLFKPTHFCWICGKAVSLTDYKVDDHGHRVHDRCYSLRVKSKSKSPEQKIRMLLWLNIGRVQSEECERMKALCDRVLEEKDPRKFAGLIFELQELLGESESGLPA